MHFFAKVHDLQLIKHEISHRHVWSKKEVEEGTYGQGGLDSESCLVTPRGRRIQIISSCLCCAVLCCAPKVAVCGHPKIYSKFSLQVPIPDLVRGSFPDFIKNEAQRQKNAPLCDPMCCALVGDVCRSPLTMMMFSTETLLSKTSSSCLLPPSVVPCAVLLLETPSGASYRKSLPKVHFKFSFEVPT